MNNQNEARFLYLFERVGEPIYYSPRGSGSNEFMYSVPMTAFTCPAVADASRITQQSFPGRRTVNVPSPTTAPNLSNVAKLCPRSSLYTYFNPQHRAATKQLKDLFISQRSLDQLFSMACTCRDSPMVNCKLWINAFASAMLVHPETRNFRIPAAWEVMPDQFFSSFTLRQAFRQAELPERDRGLLSVDNPQTGRNGNPENRLSYFREDMGINSHHWHWHLVYRLEDPQLEGRRKGELFYYMHHALIARYDADRLGFGLARVRPLSIDDNPVLKEGYYGKLFDTNSGQNWGTRQNETILRSLNRVDDQNLNPSSLRTVTLEQLRKWRDRVFEAIDTGMIITRDNKRVRLNIDILGDMVEGSDLNPNPQFYGPDGVHNVGHVLIAFSHDPEYKHLENAGPMGDTTTAMRDPIFYRWHKYIDIIFDAHKLTLQPYQDQGGDFPLAWQSVQVTNVQMRRTASGSEANRLETFFMRSHIDLSRGLDFTRTDVNRLGPIWLRFAHLNHDPFTYDITVRNNSNSQLQATVRIFLAPRMNEYGERFVMVQQRKMFFELDKFSQTLNPGENKITRNSTDSSVTVPWEQTFRDLERSMDLPTAQQSVCGCGWPQHMLLPRGNATGQIFDLVVFLTNGEEDRVPGATPLGNNCRESLSFCGRLGQPYPDRKPMGYPFDRNPFTVPNPNNPGGAQEPVENLDQYVSRIPNMQTVQVRIIHNASRTDTRGDGGPAERRREISGDPAFNPTSPMCPDQGQMPGTMGSASAPRPSSMVTSASPRPSPSTPNRSSSSGSSSPRRPSVTSSTSRPGTWTSATTTTTTSQSGRSQYGQWGHHHHHSPPSSPTAWTRVQNTRPGSPNWTWGG